MSHVKLSPHWNETCVQPSGDRKKFASFCQSRNNQIPLNEFSIESRIGSNSRDGLVYEGVHKTTHMHVAIKFMPRVYRDDWEQEIDIATHLGSLSSKNPTLPFPIVAGSGSTIIDFPQQRLLTAIGKEAVRRLAEAEGKRPAVAKRAMMTAKPEDYPDKVALLCLRACAVRHPADQNARQVLQMRCC